MSSSALPSQGSPTTGLSISGLPNLGTVPLGPDEPELFTNAMERILDHLSSDAFDRDGRHSA